jgi:transporter family protein
MLMVNLNNIDVIVLLFTIVGTICWGVAPILVKIGLTNINPLVALFIRACFTLGLIFGWLILTGRFNQFRKVNMSIVIILILEATLTTIIGDLAYFTAIKYGNVSFVTAFMASAPIITMILAIIIFKESITLTKIVGSLLIIIGVILIV